MLNSSVNAYRRLDPHYEAPNQIKRQRRRSRLDDPHPHRQRKEHARRRPLRRPRRQPVHGSLLDLQNRHPWRNFSKTKNLRQAERYLPDNIYTALDDFRKAKWTTELMGDDVKGRYADLKQAAADRCARQLGTFVKVPEVQFHHEVYNQFLWNMF